MESELLIRRFLDAGTDGYGAVYGNGTGYGKGAGNGSGAGEGCGDGDGWGYGAGNGAGNVYGTGYGKGAGNGAGTGAGTGAVYGTGDGKGAVYGTGDGWGYGSCAGIGYVRIVSLNGQKAYSIDGMPTLINSVKGNFATGGVIQPDLSVRECYIARVGKSFAHGDTLRKAFEDATRKDMRRKPVKERVAEFKREFPEPDRPYPNSGLYAWHGFLTGSCRMGRDEFAMARGIDVERGSMTVREFIGLTRGSYGGDIIAMLAKAYGIG